ncbi:hypothetical protein R4144_08545 [Gordonia amicalis]|nr:hypothetical protein [Gordonia amicalis]MDV7173437.1 hypothetical protein [Gordonia amicalis]
MALSPVFREGGAANWLGATVTFIGGLAAGTAIFGFIVSVVRNSE